MTNTKVIILILIILRLTADTSFVLAQTVQQEKIYENYLDTSKPLTLRNSSLGSTRFQNVKTRIELSDNNINGDLEFFGITFLRLYKNQSTNRHKISIKGSHATVIIEQDKLDFESEGNCYQECSMNLNAQSGSSINFKTDTLNGRTDFGGTMDPTTKRHQPVSLSFNSCHFSKKASLLVESISKLSLINCTLDSVIRLERLNSTGEKSQIELYKTDPEKLDFEVWANTEFRFPENAYPEEIQSTYLSLLSKFEKEHKRSSYKFVDIQYQNFLWNRYLYIGPSLSLIDKWWWNYGYRKSRIFIWCFAFLFVFYSLNLMLRKKLLAFYPIFNEDNPEDVKQRNMSKANRFVVIFVLTLYIFFSLRIDLSKLKISHTGMLIYFFTQYFIGLICLLFIFGAILRF